MGLTHNPTFLFKEASSLHLKQNPTFLLLCSFLRQLWGALWFLNSVLSQITGGHTAADPDLPAPRRLHKARPQTRHHVTLYEVLNIPEGLHVRCLPACVPTGLAQGPRLSAGSVLPRHTNGLILPPEPFENKTVVGQPSPTPHLPSSPAKVSPTKVEEKTQSHKQELYSTTCYVKEHINGPLNTFSSS